MSPITIQSVVHMFIQSNVSYKGTGKIWIINIYENDELIGLGL